MVLCQYASTWVGEMNFIERERKKNWDSKDEMLEVRCRTEYTNIKQMKKCETNMYTLSEISVNRKGKKTWHLLRMNDTGIPIFMNEHTATYTKNVGSA